MANRRKRNLYRPPRLINLTPHPITVLDDENRVIQQLPSQGIARSQQLMAPSDPVAGIPTARITTAALENLPEPAHGVLLIVSMITANAAKAANRWCGDLLVPGPIQRDESGNPLGCRELIWFK
jgi:hypothetical protein